ncbi:hypothetical protein PsYK624_041350 [Phanerochaete sordida]|uniref:Uncharacterized protein n=1 Tax=Phanerochaete sordida TaxID=48140 RepID=A0A9P3G4P3_9APHY|nr:hypothetical protein PsYK624_041350 [Phanerochaete sordida]
MPPSHLESGSEPRSSSSLTFWANPLQPMSLDWDTLLEIMHFSRREDASRMSRTCHTLLRHAPCILLAVDTEGRIVSINSPQRLLSFHQFMLGGRHDAFRHLKQMYLHIFARKGGRLQLSGLLSGLFGHAEELRYLEINDSRLLVVSDEVTQAFTQLRKLRTLKFLWIKTTASESQRIFETLQAPLTYVSATCSSGISVGNIDLIQLLAPFRESLRAADLRGAVWNTFDVQYPHVFSLTAYVANFESLGSMAASFPNLQELNLGLEEEEEWSEEELEEIRLWSMESQRNYMWRSLIQLCTGNTTQLYIMGIRCKVYHIIIEDMLRSELEGRLLTAVLTEVQPDILEIGLQLPTFDIYPLFHHLSPVISSLSQLRLGLEYSINEELPIDAGTCTMRILEQLSGLRLHTLSLGIHICARERKDSTQVSEWFQRSFDFEALAHHAMFTIPTLRLVALEADPWQDAELWYVCMEGEDPESSTKELASVQPETTAYQDFFNTSPMFASPPSVLISKSSRWID